MDIDILVDLFLKKNERAINTMHFTYMHDNNALSIKSLNEELKDELKTGYICFINKQYPMDELDPYLFYIANAYCKSKSIPKIKHKIDYSCPACLYLGKSNILFYTNGFFKCDLCKEALITETDHKKTLLFKSFYVHNKSGYHCADCDRFIPQPFDNSSIISCPYFDCCFVGNIDSLRKMNHPTLKSNPENLTPDNSLKDLATSNEASVVCKMEIEEDISYKIKILRDTIESQSNSVPYNSSDFTVKHKFFIYQAFDNFIKKYPIDMVDYLLNESRSGGFQHKIFQEYIRLLEESMPFSFKRKNKNYVINSLLDNQMGLFDGISIFDAVVTDNLRIKNNTKEFYIGGRKANIAKPYYIGKLLNIVNKKTKVPLIDNVLEYSFSNIKMTGILPGTEVTVTHLRVPPHYQMGGMVYVNRIRKKIIDRAKLTINNVDL